MKQLTPKQRRFYLYLSDQRNWRLPSYSQMRKFLKVTSNQTVADYITALIKKGLISKDLPYDRLKIR